MAENIITPKTFFKVLLILLVLTVLTVLLSPRVSGDWIHLGRASIAVALTIAFLKASLVLGYFMHLKFEGVWIWVYFLSSVFLLGILILGLYIDNPMRFDPEKPQIQAVN